MISEKKTNYRPPRIAEWCLKKISKQEENFSILGDYCEEYNEIVSKKNKLIADAWYWKQLFASIFPLLLNKLRWGAAMFKNYLKVTIRTLLRHKGYSIINVTGLAIGIASFLLIMLFVNNELTYDQFNKNAENIHRVNLRYHMGSNQFDMALGPVPLAWTMKSDFPEVEEVVRLYHSNYRGWITYVKIENEEFREEGFLYADSTFFKVFTCDLIEGDPETALNNPNSIILTTKTAEKYFHEEDPMGKMLTTQDGNIFTVTGITEGMPVNSNIQFDLLANYASHPKSRDPDWYDTAVMTYVLLKDGFPADQLEDKLPDFSRKYVEPVLTAAFGISYDDFIAAGNYFGFFMEPLSELHLYSHVEYSLGPKGNINTVMIFLVIALFILIVACVNFINLATARSLQRANEVGVRKVVGSGRKQLIVQFLSESTIIVFISFVIAIATMFLLLPVFSNLMGKELSTVLFHSWYFIPFLILLCLVIGLFAGGYPAFLLSSFRPITVLKGKSQSNEKGKKFRNALVVFQFVTSITLIVGTLVISEQMDFIKNKDLGYNKEHVIIVHSAHKLIPQQKPFKERISQNPKVISATYSDSLPEILLEIKNFKRESSVANDEHTLVTIMTDFDFAETYELELAAGRFFKEEFSTDSFAVLLNEAAVKAMGITDPLNERLIYMARPPVPMNIIGVLKDFHMENLHEPIKPMAAIVLRRFPAVLLSVRVAPGEIQNTLSFIEETWKQFVPGQPFEYVFFDETFEETYKTTIQASRIFSAFSFLGIFIACLGLFGLASYTAMRKTKEIGIRKVMGASESGIVFLLFKEFIKWIIAANFVAWPIAYFFMNAWLQDYAFRIELKIWMFALAGVLALIVSLGTVTYQSVKAAGKNPVEALKYE